VSVDRRVVPEEMKVVAPAVAVAPMTHLDEAK
jgi:hypothetical protein